MLTPVPEFRLLLKSDPTAVSSRGRRNLGPHMADLPCRHPLADSVFVGRRHHSLEAFPCDTAADETPWYSSEHPSVQHI